MTKMNTLFYFSLNISSFSKLLSGNLSKESMKNQQKSSGIVDKVLKILDLRRSLVLNYLKKKRPLDETRPTILRIR